MEEKEKIVKTEGKEKGGREVTRKMKMKSRKKGLEMRRRRRR